MSNRMDRANSEVKKCLTEIIMTKMNDPRVHEIVTLTEVKVSSDFLYCKVKFSVLDLEKAESVKKVLQKSEGFIKRELANMIKLPKIPKLSFTVDISTMNSIRVNEILKNLNIPKEEEEIDDDSNRDN